MTTLNGGMGINIKADLELYLVGGAVRDVALGIESNDDDYCTKYSKSEIIAYCINNNVDYFVPNEEYETVNVKIDGEYCEVTPFRKDLNADGRHCEVVKASSLEEDLARRDLTINAMALSPNGELVDPFGGNNDLGNKIIRTVGSPAQRFSEDYLRIIRVVRFATVLGFSIEPNTWEAAKMLAHNIPSNVSSERVFNEIEKALKKAQKPSRFFELFDELGLLKVYFPLLKEIKEELAEILPSPVYHPEGNTWNHLMMMVDKAKGAKIRWACLTHDLGKLKTYQKKSDGYYSFYGHQKYTDMVDEFFANFNISNELKKFCKFILGNHMKLINAPVKKTVRKLLSSYSIEEVKTLIRFAELDTCSVDNINLIATLEQLLEEVSSSSASVKPLVDGKMVMEHFGVKGQQVGVLKTKLHELQLEFGLSTAEEVLSAYTKSNGGQLQ